MDKRIALIVIGAAVLLAGVFIVMNQNSNSPEDPVEPVDPTGYVLRIESPAGVMYAQFEDTVAARQMCSQLEGSPLKVDLSDYGNFEKVGKLNLDLTATDSRITTGPGDIVLYGGDQIVIFYGSNSWSYTRLAHIPGTSSEELLEFLGTGDLSLTLSVVEQPSAN